MDFMGVERMRKAIALMAVLAVGLLGGIGAQADTGVQVKFYVGGIGDLSILCPLNGSGVSPEVGVGGGCFAVPDGAELLDISIMDHFRGDAVGIQIGWYSGGVPLTQIGEFLPACGGGVVPVPVGATQLRVFVDGLLNGPSDCGVEAPAGVGLLGSISVTPVPTGE